MTMTPGVLVSRIVAWASALAALLFAYPHMPWWMVVATGLALFPRSWAPTVLMVLVAVIWLIATETHPATLTVVRLCGLALALYYLHVSTALAAVLPRDGHAAPGLYRPWLRRIGIVTVFTIATTLLVAAMESLMTSRPTSTVTWITELVIGLPLAAGAGLALIRFGKRGRTS